MGVVTSKHDIIHPFLDLTGGERDVFKELTVLVGGQVHGVSLGSVSVSLGVEDKLVLDDVGVDDIVIHRHVS